MRQREEERERRRGVKVLYGVLSGSCIHAAVISGHPLFQAQLYTPDSLRNKTYSTLYLMSDTSKYLALDFFRTTTAN